ncbi:NgoFVII family restriction endonuclease [Planococcus sp. MERTA32b]|nr:NgoFVII family restriction endonuclease [Planococcus sp. MER TA 32b]
MFFTNNLEEKIFNVHKHINCDELQILSGYLGPTPVARLQSLSIKTKVIYGMYGSELVPEALHKVLVDNHLDGRHEILYSNIPVHSKCYVWKLQGEIVYSLIGSANFSTSSLSAGYRESLAEMTNDSFEELEKYMNHIIGNSIKCNSSEVRYIPNTSINHSSQECSMILYNPLNNEVPQGSGLNWGHSIKGHTNIGDSYITIRTEHIKKYPKLFPKKQISSNLKNQEGRSSRQSDPIELIWDDGFVMKALLEGTQPVGETRYPKQISSFPRKNILGEYLRKRMGLPGDALITIKDLEDYGRNDIKISLLKRGTYYVDFSV